MVYMCSDGCIFDVSGVKRIDKNIHTLFMYSSALNDMASMRVPMSNCMGIIHDLRLPTEGMNRESTIGDHSSLSEYG